MVELRDYQKDLLRRVKDALDEDPMARVMMQLPTGGGKTEIAGQLLKAHLTRGQKAVWLTHRKELTHQTCDRLTRADVSAKVDVSWESNDHDAPAMSNGVVILMAQKLAQRTNRGYVWANYDSSDLMVIDEAHHATAVSWKRAIMQWPGQVLGMTATPWRLTKREGFDHLFQKLICGPQVADLQRQNALCEAKVLMPPPEERILGGDPVWNGDYKPSDIELANSVRSGVMTARALKFWQEHAQDQNRQTIVYAVSVGHARNLEELFKELGITAGCVLSATDQEQAERKRVIDEFKGGNLKVLINVLIVTEGFDLPDASCIVMARPTLSLALFMQMVGRGLRPKDDGGNCLLLDLAANTEEHGLPEKNRMWSLKSRVSQARGEAPVVWCVECGGVSHAARHCCEHCGISLGANCDRCGDWRAAKRWTRKYSCGTAHDLVCDLCHVDAHVRARLSIAQDLMVPKEDLLPDEKLPRVLSKNGGYWHLLSSALESHNFKPHTLLTPDRNEIPVGNGEISVGYTSDRHRSDRLPDINTLTGEIFRYIGPWKCLLFEVAEWLVRNERLPMELMPIRFGPKRLLVHTSPEDADGTPFKDWEKLSNGLYLNMLTGSKDICQAVEKLNMVNPPNEQFYVQYAPFRRFNYVERKKEICNHPNPKLCKHPR